MSFHSLELPDYLITKLTEEGIVEPFSIQTKAIPEILAAKDVLGIAKTGSGKTLSYVLPILCGLEKKPMAKNRHIEVLVLVPTRELAIQVGEEFQSYGKSVPFEFKSMAVHGGVSINPQMKGLSGVRVLVATPGRLLELHEQKALHFKQLSVLVMDEADKMLNLGFRGEMDRIFALLPSQRQNLLFSATLSPELNEIKSMLLHDPVTVSVEGTSDPELSQIRQTAYLTSNELKGVLLRHLIRQKEMKQVLIFTSSTYQADLVASKLKKNGFSAEAIHSKRSQGARTRALENFKSGALPILVATDLLSRGIDIDDLPFVINYELPRSPKDFIHRIGRTGRAEKHGEALSFVTPEDEHHFRVIEKKMKRRADLVDAHKLGLLGNL